jgi:hypothetical protein
MSASGGGRDWVKQLQKLSSSETGSLENAIKKAFVLPLIAFAVSAADAIAAALGVPITVLSETANAIAELARALFVGPAGFLQTGARAAGDSFNTGIWRALGPFQLPVAVIAALMAIWAIAWLRNREITGNVVPGLATDVLFVGEEGEEE